MTSESTGQSPTGWPARLDQARLHFVTGKGGTGKTTVAAALALALAARGRSVLLVEVEGRQGIAQLFDVPPLPYGEQKIATAEGGGLVNALAVDTEAAFLEYLDMFYNLGIAGRAMRRIGAIEFATTIAPGLRDVLLTGKIKESVVRLDRNKRPAYDAIVVDSPPTGRIARFLDVTKAVSELAKGGPVHAQAESVVNILHSENTAIHLVTLLESLPIQETIEAIEELRELDLPIGSVIVNRNIPAILPADALPKAAEGVIDADTVRTDLGKVGVTLSDDDFAGLLTETIEHATRIRARAESAEALDDIDVPRLELPAINDGVDNATYVFEAVCLRNVLAFEASASCRHVGGRSLHAERRPSLQKFGPRAKEALGPPSSPKKALEFCHFVRSFAQFVLDAAVAAR